MVVRILGLLLVSFVFAHPKSIAQEVLRGHLFFESGAYQLTQKHERLLGIWLDSLQKLDWQGLTIEAHTDNVGTSEFNQKLANNRAVSVYKFLMSQSIDSSQVRIVFSDKDDEAETKDMDTEEQRRFQRRVDLVATLPQQEEEFSVDLEALYRPLRGNYQYFRASLRKDTAVKTQQGAVLCLRKRSFLTPSGEVYRGVVRLRLLEAADIGTRVRNNLGHPGEGLCDVLSLFEIRAQGSCGTLRMNPHQPITLLLPVDSSSSDVRMALARSEGSRPTGWFAYTERGGDAHASHKRWAGADFHQQWETGQHYEAYNYNWNQKATLKLRRALTGRRTKWGEMVEDTASNFRQAFEAAYGDLEFNDLSASTDSQQMYDAFNLPTLGWMRYETPLHISDEDLIDFAVQVPKDPQLDVKLVLTKYRSVFTGAREGNYLIFRGVPLGHGAQLVGLRINGNQSGISRKEIVIVRDYTPTIRVKQFEAITLDALKRQLSDWQLTR